LPLPGPVTPLRRSEKKRPPAPPALIAKIQYGQPIWKATEDGRRFSYLDWQSDTTDLFHILETANAKLGVRYRSIDVTLDDFSFNPAEVPVLYISGHQKFTFSDPVVEKLRGFLRDGGYLVGDACCGRRGFDTAFRRELARVLPDRRLEFLEQSHPLYSVQARIGRVEYSGMIKQNRPDLATPQLEGITLGGTLAVVYSSIGLGTQWDGMERPFAKCYATRDALKLGMNVLIYAMTH
jgi:hypothetical protein